MWFQALGRSYMTLEDLICSMAYPEPLEAEVGCTWLRYVEDVATRGVGSRLLDNEH
jgi:hypothetical protein